MDLRPLKYVPIHKVGGNLEEKFSNGTGDGPIPVFTPSDGLLIIIDSNNKIDQAFFHPLDILFTWYRKPLCCTELGMGVEIPDDLQPVESIENGRYPLVVLVMYNNSFVPPIGCLKTEGMLDDKSVLQPITEQKTEAFPLIHLS